MVDTKIYSDEKFRNLSRPQPCGQYLFLYLLIGPHTGIIPGLFRLGLGALADELGWPRETVSKLFQELFRKGMVKADFEARLIWLPNALKYNRPANPNVVKGWANRWSQLPECALRNEAFQAFRSYLKGLPEPFRNPFETVPEPFRKQEQEQEQEQEQDLIETCTKSNRPTGSPATDPQTGAAAPAVPVQESTDPKVQRDDIQEIWQHYRTHHPGTAKILRSDRKEYTLIRARLQDYDVASLKAAIDGYHKSPFHTGQNDRGTKYLALTLIMRSISHVQTGLEMLQSKSNGGPGAPRRLDASLFAGDTGAEGEK